MALDMPIHLVYASYYQLHLNGEQLAADEVTVCSCYSKWENIFPERERERESCMWIKDVVCVDNTDPYN